jgi:hypothetical protein
MPKHTTLCVACLCVSLALPANEGRAQTETTPEDETVGTICELTTISALDQGRIADWVRAKLSALAQVPKDERPGQFARFRSIFSDQHRDPDCTPAFRSQLATQIAAVAAGEFGRRDLDNTTAHVLAQVLVDMDRDETLPGLIAGLKSKSEIARLLCSAGLAARKSSIAADTAMRDETVNALREVGLVEMQPVVLGRIYLALAYPNQIASVFDAYMALFDKRLEYRRGPAVAADGAEIEAYELFSAPAVIRALTADQKVQLVRRLAVFLRLDAERYNAADLAPPEDSNAADPGFYERDRIERMLVVNEAILVALFGAGKRAAIPGELAAGGFTRKAEILALVYEWVGHPETKQQGALNEAPWNVAVGAP